MIDTYTMDCIPGYRRWQLQLPKESYRCHCVHWSKFCCMFCIPIPILFKPNSLYYCQKYHVPVLHPVYCRQQLQLKKEGSGTISIQKYLLQIIQYHKTLLGHIELLNLNPCVITRNTLQHTSSYCRQQLHQRRKDLGHFLYRNVYCKL